MLAPLAEAPHVPEERMTVDRLRDAVDA